MVIQMNRRRSYSAQFESRGGQRVGLALVVGAHILLAYALATALGVVELPLAPASSKVVIVPEEKQVETWHTTTQVDTGSITKPCLCMPVITPPIDIRIATPSESGAPPVQTASAGTAIHIPAVPPRIDRVHSVKPDYPALARRLGQHGKVTVLVLVGESGDVMDVKLDRGSGYSILDQAALDGVRRGYRFTPGTSDGRPAQMWERVEVSFELKDVN